MIEYALPLDDEFLHKYPIVTFNKGDQIIKHGQRNLFLYYIYEGVCSCTQINTEGNVITPLFLRKHDLIGVRLELLEIPENRSPHDVFAHTIVIAYKIPVYDIRELLKNDFNAYKRITKAVIHSLDRVVETANMRGKGNSVMMICNTIYNERSSTPDNNGYYKFPDFFTVTDLASSLLMHRVTVSKIMHALCCEDVLKKEGSSWWIKDLKKLNKYRQGILTLTIKK